MKEQEYYPKNPAGVSMEELSAQMDIFIGNNIPSDAKKILIIPPDLTRGHSKAGEITNILYHKLKNRLTIHIMPALGTHMPMTGEELDMMFGADIPKECFLVHDWRTKTKVIGTIPESFVSEISGGRFKEAIEVELNRDIVDGGYDLVVSVGQVVPHEVVGMANYSKNIFVGCGGRQMINKTHMVSAICGIENALGRDHAPARRLYDYAEEHFTANIPLAYILTVIKSEEKSTSLQGLFIGRSRRVFEKAVALSQKLNIVYVDRPVKKVVAYLEEYEFKSTWVGNKSVYRTRMLVEDGGEVLVLAPGIRHCGENDETDSLIRKYGYRGTENTMRLYHSKEVSYMVAAHLIHGSSEGRFTITYAAPHLSKEEIEGIGYRSMPYEDALKRYNPENLKDGFNILPDGEEIYFVRNPALGLWVANKKNA